MKKNAVTMVKDSGIDLPSVSPENTKENDLNYEKILDYLIDFASIKELVDFLDKLVKNFVDYEFYDVFLSFENKVDCYSNSDAKKNDPFILKKNFFELVLNEFENEDFLLLYGKDSDYSTKGYLLELLSYNACLFFKIKVKNESIGFISFYSQKEIVIKDIKSLRSILKLFSLAIYNFVNAKKVEPENKYFEPTDNEFKFLFEISSNLNSINDYEEVGQFIIEKIVEYNPVPNAYFISFDINKLEGKIISSISNNKLYAKNSKVRLSNNFFNTVFKNKVFYYNSDENRDFECLDLKKSLIFPIFIKEIPKFFVCIGDTSEKATLKLSSDKINLLRIIINQVSVALENIILYSEMQDLIIERTVELIESNEELKVKKDKLEKLNIRLQTIISGIPDGIVVFNENKKIINYNPAFEKIISIISNEKKIYFSGYEINEIVSFVQDKNKKKIFNELCESLESNSNEDFFELDFNIEEKFYYKILSVQTYDTDKTDDKNNNSINRILVFHDVTKEKEIDKMKSDFMAVVSHELKTPVSAMMGFSTLIEDGCVGDVTEEQQDYLQKIQIQGERLIRLINDLLDFSKLESGYIPMYKQLLDAGETVYEVIEMLRPLFDEKSMEIKENIEENIPPIFIDPDKLKQILINLIGNAIKFTPENTGLIEISVKYLEKEKSILFCIKDNGIGIPENNLKSLFSKFYQADNTSTRKYGGTGLGLAIVKKLVELNKGDVWVESKVSEGSSFYFKLPLPEEL